MKVSSKRLVYVQPVLFKTISFHHQSEYFIEFQVKYRQSHIKNQISAYPTIVNYHSQGGFTKKKIFKTLNTNKVQTEKFLILFNDQTINIKGGCNFLIETDRAANFKEQSPKSIETFLVISLMRQHIKKSADNEVISNQKGKIQKVGQVTMCINLNVLKDYSEYSCYRHIVFTNDEYFSSLLFYIDFVHLGIHLRLKDSLRLNDLSFMDEKTQKQKIRQMRSQSNRIFNHSTLRSLLEFRDLRKLYKILIEDRLNQFRRIVNLYQAAIAIRKKYVQNYEVEEPQNIEAMEFNRSDLLQVPFFLKTFIKNLDYLQAQEFLDNEYFFDHYQTEDIDQIYSSMFGESRIINKNIRKVWERLNYLKLKTLPEQFMTYALKYKIDRVTYITKVYSAVDELIYTDPDQIQERIIKHKLERKRVCNNSRFYNLNQVKHSMLTFHSEKTQNVISKTSQTNQFQILVVLVHGYQGSQRDMAKIKSFINTLTAINFLPLQTLSQKGNFDIQYLGKKGAEQLETYLEKKPYIQSINFIGFSMGGIIAKSILTNLKHHQSKFNLFMTFSSPHLGVSQIQNCLVATGIYWLKKVSKSKNMKELCCQPLNKKQGDITLLKLSQEQILSWFSHVVLIGSNQDTYVPKYSSLLAYRGCDRLIQQIQKNTLSKIKSLDQITVWFQYEQNCLDKLTGRKGHISFIEDNTFIQYIITKYLQFF